MASVPSAPTRTLEQIEARRIERAAADVDQLTVREHGVDAEDVMHREAVFEAVRAAGVLGDVAADRADHLARWIGRVVAAERRDAAGDLEIRHARLRDDAKVRNVDLEDTIHFRKADEDAVGGRQRAARQARATSPRDEWHAFAMTEPYDSLDFGGGRWQHDRTGRRAQVDERVRLDK